VGVASVPGAFFGGLVVTLTTLDFGQSGEVASGRTAALTTLLTGAVLLAVLRVAPEGVAGGVSRVLRRPSYRPAEVSA
jgi:ABC-type branched-subunit amino acid transport system permease subunit